MKKALFLLLVLVFSLQITLLVNFAEPTSIPENSLIKNLITIEIGNGEKQAAYSPKVEGVANDGPAAFAIQNKDIFVLDTLNKKIMVFDNFKWERNIDIRFTTYCTDIIVDKDQIYILDETNKIYKLNMNGEITEILNLPLDIEAYKVREMAVNKYGDLMVRVDGKDVCVQTGKAEKGAYYNGINKTILLSRNGNESILKDENGAFTSGIKFNEKSGGVKIIDSDQDGNLYIAAEEDVPNDSMALIEYTLRKINKDGTQIAFARIPLEDYSNFPKRFVNVTKNGKVYIMALKDNCVEISEVILGRKLETKMNELKQQKPDTLQISSLTSNTGGTYQAAPVTRDVAESRSASMCNYNWTYNYANSVPVNGASRPDYLNMVESFPADQLGIPYCWGGFDGVYTSSAPSLWGSFIDAMNKGKFAGNINTTAASWTSGTAGLDCSGYVSASYGYTTKYGTTGLSTLGRSVTFTTAINMDMFVDAGSHVVLFDYWSSDGTQMYTRESTTSGIDKTKFYIRDKAWLSSNGYVGRSVW